MSEPIVVPNPLPSPIPGGGPRDGYQWIYNQQYYKTRDPKLGPLSNGIAASPSANAAQLSQDDQAALANTLYDWVAPGGPGAYGPNHVDFDQEIDFGRDDPYATNFIRSQSYGYTRVPVGTGTTPQPGEVVNKDDLIGPAIPGQYLLVTMDANLL
jgi:hypothetical protein